MGGAHFQQDAAFIATSVADVRRLQDRAGLTEQSRLLDSWGCGAGRLAVGIKHTLGHVADYHGVDVQPEPIAWAAANLTDDHTRFALVDVANARYNPDGTRTQSIPAPDSSVDVFYAYSAFSHMLIDDISTYCREIARLLAFGGRAMVTAFVEEGVASWSENPPADHRMG
jgi:ubiquinone/menaquinone biosynthesis C-methylase UbiE